MKILLTVHQLFPEYSSGTEVLTLGVAKELIRRGHEVFVFTGFPAQKDCPDDVRFDEYVIEGIQVRRFHHSYVPMGGQDIVTEIEYNNHLVSRYFARIISEIEPDIIHFFHLSRLGAGLIDVVSELGIPAFFTPTDFWSVCPSSQLLLDIGGVCRGPSTHSGNCVKHVAALTRVSRVAKIARVIPDFIADKVVKLVSLDGFSTYPLCREVSAMKARRNFIVSRINALAGIISPTSLMTEILLENGVDKQRIEQLAYGIDMVGYGQKIRGEEKGKKITFGFIGTLAPHKGCHVLVDAFKEIPAGCARLKIYGRPDDFPDYYQDLKRRADQVEDIEFCGTFSNSEIATVFSGLDVLIVPSLWYENTPLVVYSALAAKCPVVASDFPGMSEVVHDGGNGLLFKAGNVSELSAHLCSLAEDITLLSRLSSHCKVPKSNVEYVDELVALYQKVEQYPSSVVAIPDRQTFKPLEKEATHNYIAGWASMKFDTPARVCIYTGDKLIGRTDRFLPRPDVRDGLRKTGARVKTDSFGFVASFTDDIDRAKARVEVEAKNGSTVDLKLKDLTCGSSVHISGGDYVGLDDERYEGKL